MAGHGNQGVGGAAVTDARSTPVEKQRHEQPLIKTTGSPVNGTSPVVAARSALRAGRAPDTLDTIVLRNAPVDNKTLAAVAAEAKKLGFELHTYEECQKLKKSADEMVSHCAGAWYPNQATAPTVANPAVVLVRHGSERCLQRKVEPERYVELPWNPQLAAFACETICFLASASDAVTKNLIDSSGTGEAAMTQWPCLSGKMVDASEVKRGDAEDALMKILIGVGIAVCVTCGCCALFCQFLGQAGRGYNINAGTLDGYMKWLANCRCLEIGVLSNSREIEFPIPSPGDGDGEIEFPATAPLPTEPPSDVVDGSGGYLELFSCGRFELYVRA